MSIACDHGSVDAAALVARLARRGDVLYAEPNYILHITTAPNDPSFPSLWGLENLGQPVAGLPGLPGADIRATDAWDVSTGSPNTVVAVIDTGVDYTHEDLAANMWTAPAPFSVNVGGSVVHCPAGSHGFNAILKTCNPMDDHNHGTHVAGTIGAVGNNQVGVVGVNWTTRIMGIKFLNAEGSGDTAGAIDSIRFAIEAKQAFAASDGANIRVLSNSWGGGDFSQALLDEINAANQADMLFVAAAGNSGLNNDLFAHYPSSYAADNVIAVAATNNFDQRAWFSNYGASSVHLAAPGDYILSTTIGNTYEAASGTSMATPHVSGAAALLLSVCRARYARAEGGPDRDGRRRRGAGRQDDHRRPPQREQRRAFVPGAAADAAEPRGASPATTACFCRGLHRLVRRATSSSARRHPADPTPRSRRT